MCSIWDNQVVITSISWKLYNYFNLHQNETLKVRNRFWPELRWFPGRRTCHTPSPCTWQCCDWRVSRCKGWWYSLCCTWYRSRVPESETLQRAGSCCATARLSGCVTPRAFCTTTQPVVPRTRCPDSARPPGTWGWISSNKPTAAIARNCPCRTAPHRNHLSFASLFHPLQKRIQFIHHRVRLSTYSDSSGFDTLSV
jgi:hypothetical protein